MTNGRAAAAVERLLGKRLAQGRVGSAMRSVWRFARRSAWREANRIRPAHIAKVLDQLVHESPSVMLMHSSLKKCGYINGGPRTIIDSVARLCETLCLPTHTYCYPKAEGELGTIFDPRQTPSRNGLITEHFRCLEHAVRSIHPTHSLAALGPQAASICAGHELCDTPCGGNTPYARLIAHDAGVLMFAVTMDTYTLFHTAEDQAHCPYAYCQRQVRLQARDLAGKLHQFNMWRQDMSARRRFGEMDTELEREGLLRRARLGKGELLYIPSSRSAHEFVIDQISRDPYYLVALRQPCKMRPSDRTVDVRKYAGA